MFFFFESEQERRVREDVEKNLQICIQNPSKYKSAKQVLEMHVSSSNQKAIEQIVDTVKATIKNEDFQPVRKYQAILLLKDLMLTHNKALGKYVVKKTLKRLTILAQHKTGTKEENDQKRGKDIFGAINRDQQKYAINFLNTLLLALEEWGKKWPKNPDGPYNDFNRQYNELVMNGVKFPNPKKVEQSEPSSKKNISPSPSRISEKKETERQRSKPKTSEVKPKMKPSLEKQLKEYFQKMKDSINLFSQCLESTTLEDFPFLKEIYAEMEKAGEKGNELVIKLEQGLQNSNQAKKIEEIFSFLETLKKQLNSISKQPDKFEEFQKKYLKKSQNLIKLLNQKQKEKEKEKEKQKQKGSQIKEQLSSLSQEKPSKSQIKTESVDPSKSKRDIPKIQPPKRYSSVTGGPTMFQFQPSVQIQSSEAKAESVHSEKFGSFGGPSTERHRAPGAVISPSQDKIKGQVNSSDKKNQQSAPTKEETRKSRESEPEIVLKEKNIQIQKVLQKKEEEPIKVEQKQEKTKTEKKVKTKQQIQQKIEENLEKSGDFFKEFAMESSKNMEKPPENPFKANDSFGAFGSQKAVSKDLSQDEDFFSKIEKDNKETGNNMNNIQPRRKPHKISEDKNFFDNNVKSQISDGLSAFDIKKPGDNSEVSDNKKVPMNDSKKSEDPFASQFHPEPTPVAKSQISEINKSVNFFEEFDNKSGKNKISSSNIIRDSGAIQLDAGSVKAENPFATGNFGNMIQQNKAEDRKNNPFQAQSVCSKKNHQRAPSNPFHENSFQKQNKSFASRKSGVSKGNPFGTQKKDPFATQQKDPFASSEQDNPFGTQQGSVENPFQTQTHHSKRNKQQIDEILQIFKPPTEKVIDNLSQRGSFKQISGPITTSPHQSKQNPRQSIVFTVNLEKQEESGLNFSQFPDVPQPGRVSQEPSHENKQEHDKSGFSLSNFAPIGGDPFAPRTSDLGKTKDFFAQFQNRSQESKHSNKEVKEPQRSSDQNLKNTRDFFAEFNGKPSQEKKESTENIKNIVQNQKTVRSSSQKSFDFSQLDRISGIQKSLGTKREQKEKKGQQSEKEVKFQDFGVRGQDQNTSRKDMNEGIQIDNVSQKSLSWNDFNITGSQQHHTMKHLGNSDHFKETDEFKSNMLQMESKHDLAENRLRSNTDRPIESSENIDKDHSIEIVLQDFAPISKKGIEWNPFKKLQNLKPSLYTYIIDDTKLKEKRKELQEVKDEYGQKVKTFKEEKLKNQQIRNKYMENMKQIDQVLAQKYQYQHILNKIKEANDIKQKNISEINNKIKAVEDIKTKILQKEKLLYELTKNQIKAEEKKTSAQRSLVSKWEMFNRNLQKNRNNTVYASSFSKGY